MLNSSRPIVRSISWVETLKRFKKLHVCGCFSKCVVSARYTKHTWRPCLSDPHSRKAMIFEVAHFILNRQVGKPLSLGPKVILPFNSIVHKLFEIPFASLTKKCLYSFQNLVASLLYTVFCWYIQNTPLKFGGRVILFGAVILKVIFHRILTVCRTSCADTVPALCSTVLCRVHSLRCFSGGHPNVLTAAMWAWHCQTFHVVKRGRKLTFLYVFPDFWNSTG